VNVDMIVYGIVPLRETSCRAVEHWQVVTRHYCPRPPIESSALVLNHISSHLLPPSDSSLICSLLQCPRSNSSFWALWLFAFTFNI